MESGFFFYEFLCIESGIYVYLYTIYDTVCITESLYRFLFESELTHTSETTYEWSIGLYGFTVYLWDDEYDITRFSWFYPRLCPEIAYDTNYFPYTRHGAIFLWMILESCHTPRTTREELSSCDMTIEHLSDMWSIGMEQCEYIYDTE